MPLISAIVRLRSLPAYFSGTQVSEQFGWNAKQTAQYIYRWKARGLIASLGSVSNMFANLIVEPSPNWELLAMEVMPSAVVVGISAMFEQEWTTQVPNRTHIAISSSDPQYDINHFRIQTRPPEWFELVKPHCTGDRRYCFLRLHRAWALADALKHCGGWQQKGFVLAPDDIEWDDVTEDDEIQYEQACKAFKHNHVPLHKQVVYSR